jgi:hypothetical protein
VNEEIIMNKDERMTTADVAPAGEDMRGRSDERIVDREGAVATEAGIDLAAPAKQSRTQSSVDRVGPTAVQPNTPLFVQKEADGLRAQWNEIQAGFVDQPRSAVERADTLVADVMKRLADGFARERDNLDRQWDHGDDVTTEDLRLALQRYRSFFDRLLSV